MPGAVREPPVGLRRPVVKVGAVGHRRRDRRLTQGERREQGDRHERPGRERECRGRGRGLRDDAHSLRDDARGLHFREPPELKAPGHHLGVRVAPEAPRPLGGPPIVAVVHDGEILGLAKFYAVTEGRADDLPPEVGSLAVVKHAMTERCAHRHRSAARGRRARVVPVGLVPGAEVAHEVSHHVPANGIGAPVEDEVVRPQFLEGGHDVLLHAARVGPVQRAVLEVVLRRRHAAVGEHWTRRVGHSIVPRPP